jgi:hypothetical protein
VTDLVPRRRSPVVESDSGERERIDTQFAPVTISPVTWSRAPFTLPPRALDYKDNKLLPHVCSSAKLYFPASPRTALARRPLFAQCVSVKVSCSRGAFGPLSPNTPTGAFSHET